MLYRRFGKFAVVLVLAGTTVLATTVSAQAGPTGPTAAPAAATRCAGPLNPAVPKPGAIRNTGSVAVGVIHLADGTCSHGTYDTILGSGQNTISAFGWQEVAAVYIGSPYRVRIKAATDTKWRFDYGPGTYTISMGGGEWDVQAYR
ncbi:hypothetical protein [Actinophytocola oryzae]|uniref:Beta/gamma crystallin n=1 Tax=Actinophytocola oryzae TaxID=502181 RepID=A0A4R7VLB2_9PSEU|nr:hypothetical protein [Actinophytocola oryzae]TDV49987.1 hypothetical protein CLV71_107335 [Actinophytocola oryzae]